MVKKYSLILIAILISGNFIYSQTELNFDFDYARFKFDDNSDYIEFYYNLNPKGMKLVEENNEKYVEAIVHIEMKNTEADSFFINKDWKIRNEIKSADSLNSLNNLAGTFGMKIPEGKYTLLIKTIDANNPELEKIISDKIDITPFENDKFSISDIQLARNIKTEGANPNSIFYKNTLEVIPNPSMLFSDKVPVVFFYSELYNLNLLDSTDNFTLTRQLFGSSGKEIYKKSKPVNQASSSVVEVGVINVSKYPTDSYTLVLSLIDNKTKQSFSSAKRFYLYNPNVVDSSGIKAVNANMLSSEFAIMTSEECDKMFLEAKYIATQDEKDRYDSIDSLNAKRDFLMRFWKSRDTDPSTPQNEYEMDYLKRVDYANEHFKHANREGYQTDRGRVYLLYGVPDQRDYFPNESDLKPYEVWFYNGIEGGVTFIFGDITGFGNYQLLHSTKRGEAKDENWMRRLSTN